MKTRSNFFNLFDVKRFLFLLLFFHPFLAQSDTSRLKNKDLDPAQGLFLRVFKQKEGPNFQKPKIIQRSPTTGISSSVHPHEGVVEAWIWSKSKREYVFYRSFSVCTYTGELGPKTKSRDYQTPEGFYQVTSINEHSQYSKALILNYPNEYDRAQGWTLGKGGPIEIHGGCVSAGCLAMNGEITELVRLAHHAESNDNHPIPVHIFPFPMTDKNLSTAREQGPQKWISFWENLKTVYDEFESSHQVPFVHYNHQRDEYSFSPSFRNYETE